jgi:hypothetical protein
MKQVSSHKLVLKISFLLLCAATFLYANQDRLPPRLSGAPGESTCLQCHNDYKLNEGKAEGGSLELVGFPDRYVPDREHFPMKIRINHPGARRWGFQISTRLADGRQAGHVHVTDIDHTDLLLAGDILYMNHTRAGTYPGREGPIEWEFEWHSEEVPGSGPITIYVAAVAADNDGTPQGDYVYTATKVLQQGERRGKPYWVAVGDFNRDGIADLARANFETDNVSIYLGGDADEVFSEPSEFDLSQHPTGNGPYMVAAGELVIAADRISFLVTANSMTNTISRWFGAGDGSFGSARQFTVGTEPRAVAMGDFNRDNSDDVVTANWGSNNVSVLLSLPDSLSFAPPVNYPVAGRPSFVAVGDLNGDDKLDLVVSNDESNQISVLLGNGDGTFAMRRDFPAGGMHPTAIAIGDFDNDGKPDVVVVNQGSNNLSFLPGDGQGGLGEAITTPVGQGPLALAAADFDEDGYLDVAVANSESNTLSLMMGQGDGTFTRREEIRVGQFPRSVAFADFDGDGIPDLVTCNMNSNDATVLLSNGEGGFAHPGRRAK